MYHQNPASSGHNESYTPALGPGFPNLDAMQAPSPVQSTFPNDHAIHRTNQRQQPARPSSLLRRSMPVDPQPPNSTSARPFDPNLSGGSLHPSLPSNYVVSHIPPMSHVVDLCLNTVIAQSDI